ncbi:ATP-binding protein [Verminephrobacter aporrectodeae]|uniref:ATP-binding protein n=1 Tax=Verminephrobacter aporrectodeae TaxID=1110389 RepID=UPI0022447A73|nr:ATP-binding protein [Verminephrobacter aporrectodeae]MCW8173910.1 ATP-binding protein [Verminephrobacter aporrectodeae subsp. tuberculatae]MCW8201480.1 ATP-binding protein [Verminephrobacter aporrectodeae subsp. tuberculatae]
MTTDDRRRAIGKVVSVAADRLVVELHGGTANFTIVGFDDIHYVARLGSFVVMPAQAEYVVAEVVGLRERDAPLSRSAQGEAVELDKAGSAKYLDLVPVGMLPQRRDGAFRFGVSTFPSLYADALYVLDEELDRIFEVQSASEIVPPPLGDGTVTRYNSLSIGTSAVFQDYAVKVRVDEFFGGHAAVLGNTGSGKSCTVATLLQSLFEKKDEFFARGATFLVLDVNGEYRSAFSELPEDIKKRYIKLDANPGADSPEAQGVSETTSVFRLPHWFMSVEEWELLLRASERTQQPVLRTALGLSTLFAQNAKQNLEELKNHILASCVLHILQSDSGTPSKRDRIIAILSTFQTTSLNLKVVSPKIVMSYGNFSYLNELIEFLTKFIKNNVTLPNYEHRQFAFDDLEHALDLALLYEEAHGNRQIRDYCSQMLTRFKWIRQREEFSFLRVSSNDPGSLELDSAQYVEWIIGLTRSADGKFEKSAQVILLDMNEAGDEVVEVASAVIARLIFERLRRAEPRNRTPINLVLEEAHRYVSERPSGHAIDASRIFQRIAKEGRKYGLFLMVASQRPSELSKTVLSQCSNFVVHRIQNPDDLQHIRQMTPFVSDSVMKRLPSLPKQHALIFGNAVNLPTTFKVRDVKPKPKSDDAAIRELWFRPFGSETELRMPE